MFESLSKKEVSSKENRDIWITSSRFSETDSEEFVWMDLHLSAAGFREPDPLQNRQWLPFEKSKNGDRKFIKLDAGHTRTLQSAEIIRTGNEITGIVLGSAGCSMKGLLVTSGKVDPNFGPQNLALAVTNASDQTIWLWEDDKIAVIGFCRTSKPLITEKITGPAQAASDFIPAFLSRIIAHTKSFFRKYRNFTFGLIFFYLFTIFTQGYVRYVVDIIIKWWVGPG